MTRHELKDAIHKAGGAVVCAHPFRERDYYEDIKLAPTASDGIEVYNAANAPNMNALAFEYCTKLGQTMTSGSDIHYFYEGDMGGMLFEHRIDSVKDYVKAIFDGSGIPVRLGNDGTITPVSEIREQTVSTALPTMRIFYPEGK